MPGALDRIKSSFLRRRRAAAFRRWVPVVARADLVTIGDLEYGGWTIPGSLLGPSSVCYLIGVGEDISFDRGLVERYDCTVHAFDPVPEAAAHVRALGDDRIVFHPVGVWSSDTTLRFSEPREEGYVSRSATDMHQTGGGMELEVRSLVSLMNELDHASIDLLKVSAEGAEYEILEHVRRERLTPAIICVEYAQPAADPNAPQRSVEQLAEAGYDVVAASIRPGGWKLCFVARSRGPQPAQRSQRAASS